LSASPKEPLAVQLDRASDRLASATVIAKAIVDARQKERTMSVLDKLDLVVTRREEFNTSLVKRADDVLERYRVADEKADRAFGKHHLRLDAEEEKLTDTEAAIDRMSNAEKNSQGLGLSSEKPNGTGGKADPHQD
jgi:5-carboxymethyl-2-hydroxymuconate isomerase